MNGVARWLVIQSAPNCSESIHSSNRAIFAKKKSTMRELLNPNTEIGIPAGEAGTDDTTSSEA